MNLILTTTYARNGSVFFQSLFDFHPQIISFPILYDWYDFFQDLSLSKEALVDDFINSKPDLFSTKQNRIMIMGKEDYRDIKYDKNGQEVDKEAFRSAFLSSKKRPQTHKELFEAYHKALAEVLYGVEGSKNIEYIFVHLHMLNEKKEELSFLLNSYPSFYFMPMARDFRENMLSFSKVVRYRTAKNQNENLIFAYTLTHSMLSSDILQIYKRVIERCDNCLVVDLSRLHLFGDRAMLKISKLLNIQYNTSLCKSTFLNISWDGNSGDGSKIYGFKQERAILNYPYELSYRDRLFTEYIMRYRLRAFNYKIAKFSKMEKISLFFYIVWFFLRIDIIKLNKNDKKILNNIKSHKDITNSFYKVFPLNIAKNLIAIAMIKNRTLAFYKLKFNLKYWIKIYKDDKKFKGARFENIKFL